MPLWQARLTLHNDSLALPRDLGSTSEVFERRVLRFRNLTNNGPLDVLVVGGGITGAPIYHELCARGYRVALIDKGDFSSGTSQASGMLVWGGLLYLRNLDLTTVIKLCKARKAMLEGYPGEMALLDMHYLASGSGRMNLAMNWLGLQLYWILGGFSLDRPGIRGSPSRDLTALGFQEAMLRDSDSRFVIERIRAFDSEDCLPINHCRLLDGRFDRRRKIWNGVLRDERTGDEHPVAARTIINAAGVWTDGLNRLLALDSPYKHVFSKGVYITFPGDSRQQVARVYPMRGRRDVLTHVPWGPVMMWGPTETKVRDLEEGLLPNRDDIRFLLDAANDSLPWKTGAEDVVSVRCGIRPLAVPRNYSRDDYPLDLSRRHRLVVHGESQALSIYGGKLTSSTMMADQAAGSIARWIPPRTARPRHELAKPEMSRHPVLNQDFVTPNWARDHEFCMTLGDYLRRRTTIAQWIPRMGLGRGDSGRAGLLELASAFSRGPEETAAIVDAYEREVRAFHDPVLAV